MKNFTSFLFLSVILTKAIGKIDKEDANLKVPELIKKYKYPLEIHHITTDDGYIITAHRIPSRNPKALPVLMVHGLIAASSDFLLLGPGKALAYKAADKGYDVWLLDVRGNSYSQNHTNLSPSKFEYWDFSFEEIGLYDVPNAIDYILSETKKTQLDYIGYTQGNTAAFVLLSMRPEYNAKFRSFSAILPAVFFKETTSVILGILGPIVKSFGPVANYIGYGEFKLSRTFLNRLASIICPTVEPICHNTYFLIYGRGDKSLDPDMYEVLTGHYPNSVSTKQIMHYSQLAETRYFRRYDYGSLENIKRYGKIRPPDYDLQNVKIKVNVHYSDSDTYVNETDVEYLISILSNSENQIYLGLNHLDMIFGDTAYKVFDNILKTLDDP